MPISVPNYNRKTDRLHFGIVIDIIGIPRGNRGQTERLLVECCRDFGESALRERLQMAREVFFSFHHEDDIWRVNQVRNANVVAGSRLAGFFDHSEYEIAKKRGKEVIQRMILSYLKDTTVTVVLIGTKTASRRWVKYEIGQSIARKKRVLGIYIHRLNDPHTRPSSRGAKPAVPQGVDFPAYDWDKDVDRFRKEIEAAGKRADALRAVK